MPGRAGLPSGVVTFVFTDIEGSTRIFRLLGDRYPPLLERHNELLRQAWQEHDGAEVKTQGEAFFVAFRDATAVLAACVRAQQLLTVEPWPDDIRLHVRIGVHSGLAAPRDGDYVALAVHQAARVVSAADGDQIIASQFTVDLVGPRPDSIRLDSLGRFRVRDFDGGVELYQVTAAGLQTEFSVPRAIPAAGHNLVRPATPFFGRESEIAALVEHVAPARIVTVLGPSTVSEVRVAA